ncbi:MAG: FHA domain-containing protein, partial [Planctomycetota bacterium]|nr:FHA domain-containing protein [Planctomycetota bacterium]
SKFHAYIQRARDGQRTLQDSGSTNGTFLSGKKIPPKSTFTLNSQLIIGFGDYCKFKFLTPELLYIRVKYFSQLT